MSQRSRASTEQGVTRTRTLSPASALRRRHEEPLTALLVAHDQGTKIVLLEPNVPVILGRMPASGVEIPDATLSREHARFMLVDGRITLQDLGSKNGTYVAERLVQSTVVDVGDEVVLGGVRVRVQQLDAAGESLGIEGDARFRQHVEAEVSRAIEFRRPFTFLVLRVVDVHENAPASGGVRLWLDEIRRRLRPVDRIGLYGHDAVQILLPETGFDAVPRVAEMLTAPIDQAETAFLVGVAVHTGSLVSADELIERACRAVRRATPSKRIEVCPEDAYVFSDKTDNDQDDVVAGPKMREVLDIVTRVASSRLPVILLGETGSGKEVIARLLHEQGPRKSKRMVRVNCGAIPKDLVESTLFGHERGAFTGAMQQQKGVFEEADKGTVFLDEIGELPLFAQAALLRVLETGSFCRVGSTKEVAVDVRIVAATHRDLDAMVTAGTFRADLYYRLGGITVEIPALAERMEDVEPLSRRFLRLANENNGRKVQAISPEAMQILRQYAWPGNVRELRNTIERAVVVTRGSVIVPEDLPLRIRGASTPARVASVPKPVVEAAPAAAEAAPAVSDAAGPMRDKVQEYEANIVRKVLEETQWNRTEAAKRIGIPLRTLSYRMKVLGIKKPET